MNTLSRFFRLLFIFLFDLLILLSTASFMDQALLLIGFPVAGAFSLSVIFFLSVSFYLRYRHTIRE